MFLCLEELTSGWADCWLGGLGTALHAPTPKEAPDNCELSRVWWLFRGGEGVWLRVVWGTMISGIGPVFCYWN